MTTGATIHTTAGLHMTVTRRSHPLVTDEATLTNIEDDDLVKEYQSL
jgi:ribosomal protein L31